MQPEVIKESIQAGNNCLTLEAIRKQKVKELPYSGSNPETKGQRIAK